MSYFFRLKNNESIELSALEVENGTYALIDSTNKCYLNFCIDPENLSWEVKKENGEILQDDNFDENITQIIRHVTPLRLNSSIAFCMAEVLSFPCLAPLAVILTVRSGNMGGTN